MSTWKEKLGVGLLASSTLLGPAGCADIDKQDIKVRQKAEVDNIAKIDARLFPQTVVALRNFHQYIMGKEARHSLTDDERDNLMEYLEQATAHLQDANRRAAEGCIEVLILSSDRQAEENKNPSAPRDSVATVNTLARATQSALQSDIASERIRAANRPVPGNSSGAQR